MTFTARQIRLLAALTLAVLPALADTNTQVSSGIGPLPANFNSMGGLVIDMIGANGKRLTAQISPTNLRSGSVTDIHQNFWAFYTQTGFDTFTLQTLLGGGLQKVNVRVTLQDGDSASPNPVYSAIFGANSMPYSGAGVRCPSCMPNNATNNFRSHPPVADFDAGTDLYIAIPLAGGGHLNCGYMGQTTTYQVDANGNTIQSYTGFLGVYALTDDNTFSSSINRRGYTPFAGTGWFSNPHLTLPIRRSSMHHLPRSTTMPPSVEPALRPNTRTDHSVISPVLPAGASPLQQCNAEIATALAAVLTGTLPLEQALLYYRDWCLERHLILHTTSSLTDQALITLPNGHIPMNPHRNTAHATTRERLAGFTERQRAREAQRLPGRASMRAYAATLRVLARTQKIAARLAAKHQFPNPRRLLTVFPARPIPAIYVYPQTSPISQTLSH
jgi:hypothetical protein